VRDSLLVSDSVYQGWKWFAVYCFRCHGEDACTPSSECAGPALGGEPTGANFPRDSFVNTALNDARTRDACLEGAARHHRDPGALLYVKARSDGWLKPGRPHRLSDLPQKTKSP